MLSDSDNSPVKNRRRTKSQVLESSSSSDDESDVPVRKRKSRHWRLSSVSSSDSEGSIIVTKAPKRLRVVSESESEISSNSGSDSEVNGFCKKWASKKGRPKARALATDSDCSDGSVEKNQAVNVASGSQSSDGDETEKCIICFKAFRGVVAHPSGCKHNFHSECLLTWSKTSNTCPIDRIKYTEVIVTQPEGDIVTRHEVKTPPPDDPGNDIEPDDPTFCEICHQHDREHEMLLCDRCESGYHLNCLDPPLVEVPLGDWFCPDCARQAVDDIIDDDEISDILRDGGVVESRLRNRPRTVPRRIGPRTRAAQRVIASIRQMAEQTERYQPSSSASRPSTRRTRKTRKSHRRRSTHYKVELITVEDGSTIEVKVAVNTRTTKRRKKKRKSNAPCGRGRKSYKRTSSAAAGENVRGNHRRMDSSIQRLDIFGSRPQLEYFSGCEAEDELDEDGGLSVIRARSSVTTVRGMANRKQMAAQMIRSAPRRPLPRITVSSAPPDLLSSILEEQTKWHSPNAVIHSNSNGEVKVILPTKPAEKGVRKAAGNGETSGGSPPNDSRGGNDERGGTTAGASSSVPPLQPPPQPPLFSRAYEEEDFDLYADIEPPRLAPPPEPPALLLALEGDEAASSPEDAMLVIDDRQTYDPDLPTSPPPSPDGSKKNCNKPEKLASFASELMVIDLSSIRLPSPEPDIDDCPNRVVYSETSINIAKEKEDSDEELELTNPLDLVCKLHIGPKAHNEEEGLTTVKEEVNNESEVESLNEKDSEIKNNFEENTKLADELVEELAPNSNTKRYDSELSEEDENNEIKSDDQANDNSIILKNSSVKLETDLNNDNGIKDDSVNDDTTVNEGTIGSNLLIVKDDPIDDLDFIKLESLKNGKGNCEECSAQSDNTKIKLKSNDETHSEELKFQTDEANFKSEIEKSCMEEGELKEEEEIETEVFKPFEEAEETKEAVSMLHREEEEPKEVSKSELLVPALYDTDDSSYEENIDEIEKDKDTLTDGDENVKSSRTSDRTPDGEERKKEIETSPDSTPLRKISSRKGDQEGEDVLELGCEDEERDGLVDITDEEISTYEKSWELEDNQATGDKTAGLEGLETEAISEGEDNMAEEGQVVRVASENGPKEEGEIISDEKRVPVEWKKANKAKERSYRDKDISKDKSKKKEKKPKEKRKELERYDVRKLISEKPKKRKVDEFGRDISPSRSSLSDSWSRSRSKSRSKSLKSKKTKSRSRSRSKKRRSRERRSKNRSRSKGRSRPKSRPRSRDRSKRRGRSVSRSRSGSRKRKSRSPRKKERRSRAKSREKKRRKRESSFSCSSCSCSSCERERRKSSKKLTVIVPNDTVRKDKKKTKYKDRGEVKRRRVDSPVPSKEVFTSGDNILVSVNFKSSKSGEVSRKDTSKKKKDDEVKKKKDKGSKENQPLRSIVSKSGSNQQVQRRNRVNAKNLKPVAIIDLAQSPFREQTLSPKEIIVLTDSESEDKRKTDESSIPTCQITGPKTPPEPHIKFNIINSKPQMLRGLANPLLDSVDQLEGEIEEEDERVELPHKGPNTPPEPPVPYDPFEPTKSRSPTPIQELEESCNPPTPPIDNILPPEPPQRPVSPPKPPPEPPKTPSPLHSPPPKPPEDNALDKVHIAPPNIINDDSDMDIVGGDSPYSPGSSDGDDIFEPPMPQLPLPISKSKLRPLQKLMPKHTPSPLKRKPGSNKITPLKNSKGSKKEPMSMKLDEDQLKILDDLPNSAVEMQVKDKFLKKLNRQERVVEEVKMVLKPHYAKKHVNKEEYKEILRKSVPKICHSRSGEINPIKIQRLIEAYVKRYRHLRKKKKMAAATFTAPESLLKPKPKPTMWC